ncbi:hypothetical protein [Leptospira interrogans]|uniref:hypothetical protein n=1 Tax=Leptospira interrogans TaxID=173 RepID=UPI0012BA0C00|nr:hypothetical protein [Leptospira interrogans]
MGTVLIKTGCFVESDSIYQTFELMLPEGHLHCNLAPAEIAVVPTGIKLDVFKLYKIETEDC